MSAPLAANETRRQLRYNYTLEERNAKATELVAALNRIDATNAELDRIKADYKSRLAAIESESELLRGCVLSGYELRDYLCHWTYDEPRSGRKTLRKREGGEIAAEEDMTERDRQMVMEIIESQVIASSAPSAEKLALPAPKDWPTTLAEVQLTEEQAQEETDFNASQTADFRERLAEIFIAYDIGNPATLRTSAEAQDYINSLIDNTHDAELERMAEWLTTGPRMQIPGAEFVASEIQTYLDNVAQQQAIHAEVERARQAAAKKKARSGRRASTSGTVDVPSDEGSRDDAGPDSKTNL